MFNAHEFLVFTKVAKMFGGTVDTDAQHRRVAVGTTYQDEHGSVQLTVVFDPQHGNVTFHTKVDGKWHTVPQGNVSKSSEWYAHLRLACDGGVQLR